MSTRAIPLLLAGLSFVYPGCSQRTVTSATTAAANTPTYGKRFDPWRASNFALEPASRGDRDAQDVIFLAAYVRLNQPYMGGEDLEQMRHNFESLLSALGDEAFCAALLRHRPEVRSAANWFLETNGTRRKYPKTNQLLQDAPKIDWATDKAYRDG